MELGEALNRLRERIERYKDSRLNEDDTRAILIDPLLRALGWDVEDRDEVRRQYRFQSGDNPVDYALLLAGRQRLFVEAKALGENLEDRRWTQQIMMYAGVAGIEWIVLTNGNEYRLYNAHATVPIDQKLFRRILIEQGRERAEDTLLLLSKGSMQRDEMSMLWQAYFVDRHVRSTVEHLFAPLPDDALVKLVAERNRGLTEEDVRASLHRIHVHIDMHEHVAAARIPVPIDVERANPSLQPARLRGKRSFGVSVDDLIRAGLINPPMHLEHTRNGKRILAQVQENGTIHWEGRSFPSLSTAAGAALTAVIGPRSGGQNRAVDGWDFWHYQDADGQLKAIDALRQRFLAKVTP